jgi:hypothetical protein
MNTAIIILLSAVAGAIATAIITNSKRTKTNKRVQKVLNEVAEARTKLNASSAEFVANLPYETRTKLYHLSDRVNVALKEAGLNAGGLL